MRFSTNSSFVREPSTCHRLTRYPGYTHQFFHPIFQFSPLPMDNSKLLSRWVVVGPLRKLFYFLGNRHGDGLIPGWQLCLLHALLSWWSYFQFHPLNSSFVLAPELFFPKYWNEWITLTLGNLPIIQKIEHTLHVGYAFQKGSNLPSPFTFHCCL